MIRKIALLLSFLLIQSVFVSINAQCVRTSVKVDRFSGRVFYLSRDGKEQGAFPNASIKLIKRNEKGDEKVIELTSDANGTFAADNIRKGTYILTVYAQHFDTIVTDLKILKNFGSRKDSTLAIGLGITDYSGTDSCEGFVKAFKNP